MGHKYSIRSDAISRVNGVRAIVLEPHEHVLNITYRNSLSEHSIVHIHGINPEARSSQPRSVLSTHHFDCISVLMLLVQCGRRMATARMGSPS
jgi:hypothetical protein